MVDKIIQGKTRTRRQFCSFYTDSDPIQTYMVARLKVANGDTILEPCAGDGVFIDKILKANFGRNFTIHAFDINPDAVNNLIARFNFNNIIIKQADTLLDESLNLLVRSKGYYDKVIGNPPYGAWQDYDRRDLLKKTYGGYVRETYTLFLKRCIELLKTNGKLVFIVPDTFLAIHLHKNIRKFILENTRIDEILLIPSHFFPGVNFGYSNLCIISLTKSTEINKHSINIVSVFDNIENLYNIADHNYTVAGDFESFPQNSILTAVDYSFLIGGNSKIRKLINNSKLKLGDLAYCVTGFYSGDNRRFMAVNNRCAKYASKYNLVDDSLIDYDFINKPYLLSGLKNNKIYIPIVKGGGGAFMCDTEWFIRWDQKTINLYKTDKRSRFQNSQYYFKQGIGVPMVISSKIRAFLLNNRLFDQSIVGIFPKDPDNLNYLLAFLNSNVCSKLLKVINHTANNSANYIKKLPIIIDKYSKESIDKIMGEFWSTKDVKSCLSSVDTVFDKIYKI